MHDTKALEQVAKAGKDEALDGVQSYFGPYIGLYFSWLRFYTR